MTIFLFTNFFPYRRSEPFLVNEIPFTAQNAGRIVIIPLYGEQGRQESAVPANAVVKKPVFSHPGAKLSMFVRGIFCLSGLSPHLHDLLCVRNRRQFRQWITTLFVTRAILSHGPFKEVVREIASTPDALMYFYWGDNLANSLPYLRRKKEFKGIPALVRLHRTDLYEWLKGGHIPLRPELMRCADLLVPISEDGRQYLVENYPAYAKKIWLSRLGVPDRGLGPVPPDTGGDPVVVSISAVTPVKRVQMILQALQSCGLPVVWHHFGDGPALDEVRSAAQTAGNGIRAVLHGFKPNREVMEFFMSTPVHLLVNASFSEGLPVSVMEAMSFGIPVVATNAGGTSDMVNDRTGGLVAVDADAKTLGSAIARVFRLDRQTYLSMRHAARAQFENVAHADKNYGSFYAKIKGLL